MTPPAIPRTLAALLGGTLAVFGGAYSFTTLPILVASTAFLVIGVLAAGDARYLLPRLDIPLIALGTAIALQLVPLPIALVDVLSPDAGEIRRSLAVNRLYLGDVRWVPLTIDSAATVQALATYWAALFVFWGARAMFATGGARILIRWLGWIGAVISVAAIAFRATAPRLLYGYWQPETAAASTFGPYVDRNLFAAWLALAGCLVGGYVVLHARRGFVAHRAREWVLIASSSSATPIVVCFVILVATLLLTMSRAAIVGFSVGTATAWWIAARRMTWRWRPAVAVAVVGVVLVAALAPAALVERFSRTFEASSATGRVEIWAETLRIAHDFAMTGTGAGAFERAMLISQQSQREVFFNFAHNHYLQVATEGGLLLSIPLVWTLIAFAHAAAQHLAGDLTDRYWLRLGAFAGIVGTSVHAIWDAPIQMPANALLFATAAALIVAPTAPRVQEDVRRAAHRTALRTNRRT